MDENTNLTISNLQKQAEAVINIAYEFNRQDLIVPFINSNNLTFESVAQEIASKNMNINEFSNTIFSYFNQIDMIDGEYPRFIDVAFEKLFEVLNIDYVKQTTEDEVFSPEKIAKVKDSLKTIFTNVLKVVVDYTKSVDWDFDAVSTEENVLTASLITRSVENNEKTKEVFNCVGEILNIVRVKPENEEEEKLNLLNETNYSKLLIFAKNNANELTRNIINVSCVINSMDDVDNWRDELNNYSSLYRAVIRIVNSGKSFDELKDEDDLLLNNLGHGIGVAVGQSVLINNKNIKTIASKLLEDNDEYFGSLNDVFSILVEDTATVKDTILNNIYYYDELLEQETSNVGSDWENEIACFKKLLGADFSDIELQTIGPILDDVSSSKIFTRKVLNAIILKTIDQFSNQIFTYDGTHPYDDDDEDESHHMPESLRNAITTLKNNISNNNFSFETEFEYLQGLFDVIDDEYTADTENNLTKEEVMLLALGHQFDVVCKNSAILDKAICNYLLSYYIDEYVSSLDADLVEIINGIKDCLEDIDSYELEFNNLVLLSKTLKTTYEPDIDNGLNADEVKLLALGDVFDKICAMGEYSNQQNYVASSIITPSILNDIVKRFFNSYITSAQFQDMDSGVKTIIQKITNTNHSSNYNEITSYKAEFEEILRLAKIASDGSATLEEIGNAFNSLRSNSHIISDDIIEELISLYFDREVEDYNSEYGTIISQIKNEILDAEDYETAFEELMEITSGLLDVLQGHDDISNPTPIDESNIGGLGELLDDIAGASEECFEEISDPTIAKEISDLVLDKLAETYSGDEAATSAIESKLSEYGYNSSAQTYSGSYSELFNAIADLISSSNP